MMLNLTFKSQPCCPWNYDCLRFPDIGFVYWEQVGEFRTLPDTMMQEEEDEGGTYDHTSLLDLRKRKSPATMWCCSFVKTICLSLTFLTLVCSVNLSSDCFCVWYLMRVINILVYVIICVLCVIELNMETAYIKIRILNFWQLLPFCLGNWLARFHNILLNFSQFIINLLSWNDHKSVNFWHLCNSIK